MEKFFQAPAKHKDQIITEVPSYSRRNWETLFLRLEIIEEKLDCLIEGPKEVPKETPGDSKKRKTPTLSKEAKASEKKAKLPVPRALSFCPSCKRSHGISDKPLLLAHGPRGTWCKRCETDKTREEKRTIKHV